MGSLCCSCCLSTYAVNTREINRYTVGEVGVFGTTHGVWEVVSIVPVTPGATSGHGYLKIKTTNFISTRDISRYQTGQFMQCGEGIVVIVSIRPTAAFSKSGPGRLTVRRHIAKEQEGLNAPLLQTGAQGAPEDGPMLLHVASATGVAAARAAAVAAFAALETKKVATTTLVAVLGVVNALKQLSARAAAISLAASNEARRLAEAPVVVFDTKSGLPLNDAACDYCAAMWGDDSAPLPALPLHDARYGNLVSYAELRVATGKFGDRHLIGDGGSCKVYRAEVYGVAVAVKVMTENTSRTAQQSVERKTAEAAWNAKQFQAELELLQSVDHTHITRLLATSDNGPTQALLLEFMEGGALDRRTANKKKPILQWQDRLTSLVHTARALSYLHSRQPCLVHRDVKCGNVLLSGAEWAEIEATSKRSGKKSTKGGKGRRSLTAKLADFGTVRTNAELSGAGEQSIEAAQLTHVRTNLVCGTKPYMAPEYVQRGHVSEKTDAFAFGLMIAELLTGLHPTHARTLIDEVSVTMCVAIIHAYACYA
jgi:hypothetical protein